MTERTIQVITGQSGKPLSWVAVLHDDHTPLRHVHALVIVKKRLLPVKAMRQEATAASLQQRYQLDLALHKEQEAQRDKEEEWGLGY